MMTTSQNMNKVLKVFKNYISSNDCQNSYWYTVYTLMYNTASMGIQQKQGYINEDTSKNSMLDKSRHSGKTGMVFIIIGKMLTGDDSFFRSLRDLKGCCTA